MFFFFGREETFHVLPPNTLMRDKNFGKFRKAPEVWGSLSGMESVQPTTATHLAEKYYSYVELVVGKLIQHMHLPLEIADDCISAGYLGLVEAASRYDKQGKGSFQSFAFLRIRGAVIDYLRKSSDLSGTAYRYARALEAIQYVREEDYERNLGDSVEMSASERLAQIMDFAASGALAFRMSMEDALEKEDEALDPEQLMMRQDKLRAWSELIEQLDEKEQLIVRQYYFQGKSFVDIAKSTPGLSKSWVSRLHSRALKKLKDLYLERASHE